MKNLYTYNKYFFLNTIVEIVIVSGNRYSQIDDFFGLRIKVIWITCGFNRMTLHLILQIQLVKEKLSGEIK